MTSKRRVVIKLAGDLDRDAAGPLREQVLSGLVQGDAITIDASALETVDVAGLQVLCAAQRQALRDDKQMGLASEAGVEALCRASESLFTCRGQRCGACFIWKGRCG